MIPSPESLLRVPQSVLATQEYIYMLIYSFIDAFIYLFKRKNKTFSENYNPYRSSSHLRIPVIFFLLNYVKTKLKYYFSQGLILLFCWYSWSPSQELHMSHKNVNLDLLFSFIHTVVYLESYFTYSVGFWTNFY